MEYGKKLNLGHSLRMTRGIKEPDKVIITYNPNEIDQNQLLLVRFLNLGSEGIIISGILKLSFNIRLSLMADPKILLVSNMGRMIVKKLAVKFEGNEIWGVDDFNMSACNRDLWKTE